MNRALAYSATRNARQGVGPGRGRAPRRAMPVCGCWDCLTAGQANARIRREGAPARSFWLSGRGHRRDRAGQGRNRQPCGGLSPPPPAPLRGAREQHEEAGDPGALVPVIDAGLLSGFDGERRAGLPGQLLRGLVEADQRMDRIVRARTDLQHILHRRDESGAGFRRDDPAARRPEDARRVARHGPGRVSVQTGSADRPD